MTLSMVLVWAAGIAITVIVIWSNPGLGGGGVETTSHTPVTDQPSESRQERSAPPEAPTEAQDGHDRTWHTAVAAPSSVIMPVSVPAAAGSPAAGSSTPVQPMAAPQSAAPQSAESTQPSPTPERQQPATNSIPNPTPKPDTTPDSPAASIPTIPDEDPPLAPPSW